MAECDCSLLVASMRVTTSGLLLTVSVAMTTAVAVAVFGDALGGRAKVAYDEIDVRRINVREEDGRLRLVISNQQRFPGLFFRDKEHPHPNRKTAGLLFFNEEGTENGGLIFGGKKVDGRVTGSGGQLSFDRYEQDQVVQIMNDEEGEQRLAGFAVNDYPDGSMDLDAWERADAMPEGPEKVAELRRLGELYGGKRRLILGRMRGPLGAPRRKRRGRPAAAGPRGRAGRRRGDPLPGRKRQARTHRDGRPCGRRGTLSGWRKSPCRSS